MSNLAIFKSAVGNLSYQYNFAVSIPNLPGADGSLIKFLAKGVTTPDAENAKVDLSWRGRKGSLPGAVRTDGELELTCIIDQYWRLYDQLYLAKQITGNNITGESGVYPVITFTTMLKMLGPGDVTLKTFTLLDCWLMKLGGVDKAHDDDSTPDEVSFTIAYDNWVYG